MEGHARQSSQGRSTTDLYLNFQCYRPVSKQVFHFGISDVREKKLVSWTPDTVPFVVAVYMPDDSWRDITFLFNKGIGEGLGRRPTEEHALKEGHLPKAKRS